MTPQLRDRVLSAGLLLPLVVALVWLGPWTYLILLSGVAILGGWELASILRQLGWTAPRLLPWLSALALIAALWLGTRTVVTVLTALAWVASTLWLFWPYVPPGRKSKLLSWLLHLGGACFLGLFLACFGRLVTGPWPGDSGEGTGQLRVLYALAVVWAGDTGAYLVGSLWGRRPLWPAVSPKKTWEGAIGGTLSSVLAAVALAGPLLGEVRLFDAALLGLGATVAGQIGDLFESRLKRKAGMKDSGALLPGHGGILDRLDSLLFAAPVFCYGLKLMLP